MFHVEHAGHAAQDKDFHISFDESPLDPRLCRGVHSFVHSFVTFCTPVRLASRSFAP
jgi:hypothetical protein